MAGAGSPRRGRPPPSIEDMHFGTRDAEAADATSISIVDTAPGLRLLAGVSVDTRRGDGHKLDTGVPVFGELVQADSSAVGVAGRLPDRSNR